MRRNIILGLCCLVLIGFSLYWPLIKSTDHKRYLLKNAISRGLSENDILVTEHDLNSGKVEELSPSLTEYILKDRGNRVLDTFEVTDDIRKRVEFWFKIYSVYTISNVVLHDNAHPWIVYTVINLNSVYDKYHSKEQRNSEKSKMIRSARYRYIDILDRLSKRSHYFNLSKEEKEVYNLFKDIPGSREKIFSKAKHTIRVQKGQNDSVLYAIKKSGRYLKSMENIFVKEELPIELTRIPFLESSFNIDAYSKDGASGVWQFMFKTGKAFMRVSHAQGIDERNHPLKATIAAAHLLKQNYQILKSWPLAVTAYNHGPGGILQGIQKIKSRNLNDLIENYSHSYFGFASKNFYSEFLAILHIEKYQDKIFGTIKKDDHLEHDDIEIQYAMRVKFIMELCEVTKEEIKLYNPDLRSKILDSYAYLPERYYLKLPKGKKKALLDFYEEVEETNKLLDQILGKEDG